MAPALYVVATPIGNLADITLRAIEVLRAADLVACEDTRHARPLLDRHGIRTPLLALHQHNEAATAQRVVAELAAGRRVALISDAGTPGISDPGSRTVAAVRAAGFPVVPLPGANAAATALSAAGLEAPHFLFAGFLPTRAAARRDALSQLAGVDALLVFYEAPHRVAETVADLAAVLGGTRELVIARELTKLFEQIVRLPLTDAAEWLAADDNRRRGEFVLIVGPPPPVTGLPADAERVLRLLLEDCSVRTAVRLTVELTGARRERVYSEALRLAAEH